MHWLLRDLSDWYPDTDDSARESAILPGRTNLYESIPAEFAPDQDCRDVFASVLTESAARLAHTVGVLTERILTKRGHNIVLASLLRGGTPFGILIRRWAQRVHGLTLPHYSVSLLQGRGIDTAALDYLASNYDPAAVAFVDGWSGKGTIAGELKSALRSYGRATGVEFNSDLAVLADPGRCVSTFGTRDDFLIASACLNSTATGLVSRAVPTPRAIRSGDFYGARYYRTLVHCDDSVAFLDSVSGCFDSVSESVRRDTVDSHTRHSAPSALAIGAARRIQRQYQLDNVNFVKLGLSETMRVLLRQRPFRIILREPNDFVHRHLRALAAARRVEIICDPDLVVSSAGLIKDSSVAAPGDRQ